jgi:hypothetical protein
MCLCHLKGETQPVSSSSTPLRPFAAHKKNEDLQVTFDDGSSFDIFPGEEILKGRDFVCF